ncbi:MAG: Na-translocating system protein MpsB, partial [Nitrospiraceae bacterium]|nr:Na-translocating system protein MpsB [Nitrospiraceae bacterium]
MKTGPQSDLRTGLARQTVRRGDRPYHEPMRLLTLIEAPPERIGEIILRHLILQQFYDNEWVRLTSLDPLDGTVR